MPSQGCRSGKDSVGRDGANKRDGDARDEAASGPLAERSEPRPELPVARSRSLTGGPETQYAPVDDETSMRVLLTGGGGFIGSHLCGELIEAGHDVAVLTRTPEPWRLRDLLDRVTTIHGDLACLDDCSAAIEAFAPLAIAHLGWQGVANFDRNNAVQVRNIGWMADLLDLGRRIGTRVFLGLGSQAEYGRRSSVIGPDDETRPTTLYGECKLAAGRIGARMAEDAGMRFVWMRVFSTFGPTDHAYWMVPGLIGSLLKGERPALTPGGQTWDFLFVGDAARAIRLALETDAAAGFYALGSGSAPTLRSTVEAIRDAVDPSLPLGFGDVAYRPDQVMCLQADISALRRDLGWEPRTRLDQGISETVAWYRANPWIFKRGASPS